MTFLINLVYTNAVELVITDAGTTIRNEPLDEQIFENINALKDLNEFANSFRDSGDIPEG